MSRTCNLMCLVNLGHEHGDASTIFDTTVIIAARVEVVATLKREDYPTKLGLALGLPLTGSFSGCFNPTSQILYLHFNVD